MPTKSESYCKQIDLNTMPQKKIAQSSAETIFSKLHPPLKPKQITTMIHTIRQKDKCPSISASIQWHTYIKKTNFKKKYGTGYIRVKIKLK